MTRRALFLLALAPFARAERSKVRQFTDQWKEYSREQAAFAGEWNGYVTSEVRKNRLYPANVSRAWHSFRGEAKEMLSAGDRMLDAISRGE